MKKTSNRFLFIALILLAFSASVFADIAIPRAKNVSIQTNKNFPEYNFYFCEIPVTSYYDMGRHYTTHFEDLEVNAIKFSAKNPYRISETQTDNKMYFVAIKKDSAPKDLNELKDKLIKLFKDNDGSGIFYFQINTVDEDGYSSRVKRSLIYTVEKIDETQVKTNRTFKGGKPIGKAVSEIDSEGIEVNRTFGELTPSYFNQIALGFLATGAFIFFGLIFIRRTKNSI
ncbi:MAG: hypothetical protein K1X72_10080 [Pyrinomonadaceae bacterium]|nr:hypothetical protein [Pyrinomonadaceae bacterium]